MDTEIYSFNSLMLNRRYEVHGFRIIQRTVWILLVSEEQSDETFELRATPQLVTYLEKERPTEMFHFSVKKNEKGNKYPFIVESKWKLLDSSEWN